MEKGFERISEKFPVLSVPLMTMLRMQDFQKAVFRAIKNGVTTANTIRYDDPDIQEWYESIVSFPPKLYTEMNKIVASALHKYFADPPCIDEEEPFGH